MARYCTVCFFELPLGSDPIESTDIRAVGKRNRGYYDKSASQLCDLNGPLSKNDIQNIDVDHKRFIFKFESLQKSARRGCNGCAAIHRIITKLRTDKIETEIPEFSWAPDFTGLRFQLITDKKEYYRLLHQDTNYANLLPELYYLHPTIAGLPSSDTSSNAAFSRIEQWLADCITKHGSCGGDEETSLPHRILFVGKENEMKLLDRVDRKAKYACLSYRWGTVSSPLRLVASNLSQFKEGIPDHLLPLLFREARNVVLRLGLRYLWIDSLCILQDDPEDWRVQAASMASIYKNAHVTIAAAVSVGCHDSLFRKAKFTSKHMEMVELQGRPVYLTECLLHPWDLGSQVPSREWNEFPLLSRGWVYQERLLSRRMIYFAEHEILWECMESKRCECRFGEEFYGIDVKLNTTSRLWKETVDIFTSMKLSEPKDRLPAIAGIAKQYASSNRGEYLAGIWEKEFHDSVLWSRNKYCYDESLCQLLPRPQPQSAPTWSWASIQSAVAFFYGSNEYIQLLRWSMEGKGPDEYGEMRTASLTVSSPAVSGKIYYGTDADDLKADNNYKSYALPKMHNASKDGELRDEDFIVVVENDIVTWYPDYLLCKSGKGYVESGADVLCLIATTNIIIVLCCIDAERGYFERIGITSFSGVFKYWLEDASNIELILV